MGVQKESSLRGHGARHQGPSPLLFVGGAVSLAALFLLGFLPKIARNHQLGEEAKAAALNVPKVGVVHPLPAENEDLVLPGSTLAIEDAVIGARTTGYLAKRFVDIGSHVRAGQVLAVIQSPDVDSQLYQADSQVAQAQATVEQSKADVFNKQATVAQYQSNVRQAEANREQARASLADSQAKLAQLVTAVGASEAQLKQAQHNVSIKEAAVAQAKTTRNLAEVTFKRYQSLYKDGYAAAQDVDQYRAAFENSEASVTSSEADLSAAQSAADAADQAVQGAKANVKSGEAEVRAARKNIDAATATIGASQANVKAGIAAVHGSLSTVRANQFAAQANVFNKQHFKDLTSFEKVTAPFDGVITARNIEVGSLVSSGSGSASSSGSGNTSLVGSASTSSSSPSTTPSGGLFGLARTDIIRILVSVPAVYARDIHSGMLVKVDFDRELPGRIFDGVIARASGAIDATSRTLLTEVHIDNHSGVLLPGMFGQVHFDLPRQQGAVRVPAGAITYDAFGTRVAILGPGDKLHFIDVKVGRDYGQVLEITQGLTGRETLVANPSADMSEGEQVRPYAAPVVLSQDGKSASDAAGGRKKGPVRPGAEPASGAPGR